MFSPIVTTLIVCFLISPVALSAQATKSSGASRQGALDLDGTVTATCKQIPTQDEVNTGNLGYQDRYYTAKEAFALKIPLANYRGDRDYLVIVRDYRRSKTCDSTDGSYQLEYGHVIRAVIEVLSVSGATNVTLATVAADGTLNRRTQYFYLYKDGMFNTRIDSVIADVSGKVFDVENYALYQAIMPQLIRLLSDPNTQLSVNLIGIYPKDPDAAYSGAPIVAYALTNVADGRTCSEAANKFRGDRIAVSQITALYMTLVGSCGDTRPGRQTSDKAKQILRGVRAN